MDKERKARERWRKVLSFLFPLKIQAPFFLITVHPPKKGKPFFLTVHNNLG